MPVEMLVMWVKFSVALVLFVLFVGVFVKAMECLREVDAPQRNTNRLPKGDTEDGK